MISYDICISLSDLLGYLGDSVVKNLPDDEGDTGDTGWSLGQKDPLEEGMVTHSSILAWKIPRTEKPGGLQSTGSQRVGYDWACLSYFIYHDNLQVHPRWYSLIQFSSVTHSRLTLCDPTDYITPGFLVHQQLLELTQTHVHQVSDAIQPSQNCALLLRLSIFPNIRVFSSESVLPLRWPKYWSFSFSISLSNEYLELISFRINWFDLAVQRTLKSLLQHHSSKADILQCSAFFIVQLSQPYMTTGKTIALTRQTFVGKIMSLCFLICCLGWS